MQNKLHEWREKYLNEKEEHLNQREQSQDPATARAHDAGQSAISGRENDPPTDADASRDQSTEQRSANSEMAFLPYDNGPVESPSDEEARVIEGIEYDGPPPDILLNNGSVYERGEIRDFGPEYYRNSESEIERGTDPERESEVERDVDSEKGHDKDPGLSL